MRAANAGENGSAEFVKDPDWGHLPNGWVWGSVSGVAIDADDHVWVLHRPRAVSAEQSAKAAPPVVVFDADGNFLDAWGGPAAGLDWPQSEHGIHVDNRGFVWISGNNCAGMGTPGLDPVDDDQVLKLTRDGDLVMQIGRKSQSRGNADTRNFHRPAAMAVYAPTNELFVADGYGNHRVIVLDADTGAYKRMWGAFGSTPIDDNRCGPQFLGADAPAWNREQFSIVHSISVANDGMVYVADRENGRIQVFNLDGTYVSQIEDDARTALMCVALSPDAEQRYLYVWAGGQLRIYDRHTLGLVGAIDDDPTSTGPGHLMAVDSRGNVYLARLTGGIEKLVKTVKPEP